VSRLLSWTCEVTIYSSVLRLIDFWFFSETGVPGGKDRLALRQPMKGRRVGHP